MPRTAAEIDAAKLLNKTDLGAVTSEVRQFSPGYVTGGRLKLNTNLQIEVAPIVINITGKDVRITDTTIIDTTDWVVNGVETPRVPGSWYYLYLGPDAVFAVSPNEPTYNTTYFAYYHPIVSDLRVIGKFYYGTAQVSSPAVTWTGIFYVQSSLEISPSEVWIGNSDITDKNIDYICEKNGDVNTFLIVASMYLYNVFGGGIIHFTDGTFYFIDQTPNNMLFIRTSVSVEGSGNTIWDYDATEYPSFYTTFYSGAAAFFRNIIIKRGRISWYLSNGKIENIRGYDYGELTVGANNCIISNNHFASTYYGTPFFINGNKNIITNNHIHNCVQINNGTEYYGLRIAGTGNIISNNYCYDNGNLIRRSRCDTSSTSPMVLDESAPTASNCTWGFTADGPYEGTGCYRFTKSAAAGTIAYLHLVDNVGAADVHGLIPGTQYEWGGWFKVSSSGSCGYQGFRIYQATTAAGAASAVAFTTATTGWQWLAATATVYVNATTAYIDLVASTSLGNGFVFDVDNLRLFPPGTTNVHNQNYSDGGTNTYDGL